MIAWLTRSRKSITALVGACLAWALVAYVPDGSVSRVEWYALAVAVATALGVYVAPNEPNAGKDLASSAAADGYTVEPLADRTGTPGSSYSAEF